MKFKSYAFPAPSVGVVSDGKKIVVPNQSMSLQEILERFTREEKLPIGKEINYHESEDDLEKVAKGDLVDREEFAEKMRETQRTYKRQEAQKEKAAKEKIAAEFKQKVEDDLKRAAVKAPKAE